ncbi:MAG: hypothetical protein LBC45_02270 [Chlamydiales bacterium]|jgi:hypothetical protein|nr:hypothetical protein [Chlamydiales bacterium]
MISLTRPLQGSRTVTVNMPIQTSSTTKRKTALIAAKIISLLAIGIGIGCLIATKTVKSDSCLENTNHSDAAFWEGCCRPLFDFIECLQQKQIPNFSYILNQCPTSSDCDP